jgi:hypothetical protein
MVVPNPRPQLLGKRGGGIHGRCLTWPVTQPMIRMGRNGVGGGIRKNCVAPQKSAHSACRRVMRKAAALSAAHFRHFFLHKIGKTVSCAIFSSVHVMVIVCYAV